MTNEEILCAHWSTMDMTHSFTINVFMIKDWNFYEKTCLKISSWNFNTAQGQAIHQGYPGREQGRKKWTRDNSGSLYLEINEFTDSPWLISLNFVIYSRYRDPFVLWIAQMRIITVILKKKLPISSIILI